MKKIGSLVLVLVVVTSMVLVVGCVTTTRFPDHSVRGGYTEISGDLPKLGQIIHVRSVAGHETSGPYQIDVIWSYHREEVGDHFFTAQGSLPGLGKEGDYVVARGVDGGIYFAEIK